VNDTSSVLETTALVGGFNRVVVETEVESADDIAPLIDRIVIGEYAVYAASPVTVTGLDVMSASTAAPPTYTV
jgi:hypothetical protein